MMALSTMNVIEATTDNPGNLSNISEKNFVCLTPETPKNKQIWLSINNNNVMRFSWITISVFIHANRLNSDRFTIPTIHIS